MSLIAAGGWCAPAELHYAFWDHNYIGPIDWDTIDLSRAVKAMETGVLEPKPAIDWDAILSLPTISVPRGRISFDAMYPPPGEEWDDA